MAVSADGERWILINASPDLGFQINSFPLLHPRQPGGRESRISAVLLTNGDLDHVLGLLLLREGPSMAVTATAAVWETLRATGIEGLLAAFSKVGWSEVDGEWMEAAGLTMRGIFLPGQPPPYLESSPHTAGHSVAYQIEDRRTGARLLVAPDVSAITPELAAAMDDSEIVLFDGTFWSSDELRSVRPGARLAEEMGHLPINGGSLDAMRNSPARYKAYFHINNTNPILDPASAERRAVEAAGVIVGYDGLEFEL